MIGHASLYIFDLINASWVIRQAKIEKAGVLTLEEASWEMIHSLKAVGNRDSFEDWMKSFDFWTVQRVIGGKLVNIEISDQE